MATFKELFSTGARDVQNHYQQFLTGQNAPMISPDSEPAAEAPYGGLSHSEKDVGYVRPTAPPPNALNGETLAPEKEAQPWPSAPSAFERVTNHQVTDAEYTDISGQQSLPGPQPGSSPEQDTSHGPEL
jgi:hypothetical protein